MKSSSIISYKLHTVMMSWIYYMATAMLMDVIATEQHCSKIMKPPRSLPLQMA